MKITHPVDGYNGHVSVGQHGFHFLAGVAHADDLPDGVRTVLEASGFTVADERRSGGPLDEGATYLVGEHGPEVAIPANGDQPQAE